jgi:glucose/arabinose dehydrogenase
MLRDMLDTWTSAWVLRIGLGLGAVGIGLGAAACGSDSPSPPRDQPADKDAGKTPRKDAGADEEPDDEAAAPTGGRDGGRADAGRGPVVPPRDAGGDAPTVEDDAGGGPVIVAPTECDATSAPDLSKLGLQTVPGATGLSKLVFAAQPPGSSDWYFLEQTGAIKVLTGGALKPTPFLNLSSKITLMNFPGVDDERGLLGMAFPPDYAESGLFYVMLTPSGNADTVFEFKRSSADPYVAEPKETNTLVTLPSSALNHNSGHLAFDKEGLLYVGVGDGGGSCNSDQPGAPQDTKKLFGKILRLDPKAAGPNYAAAGNPFADGSKGDPRVWHYGLRNPYRFAFDPATSDLYIGDVGQDRSEEVDFVAAGSAGGLNFGWPAVEGTNMGTCAGRSLAAGATATAPIFVTERGVAQSGPYADWISVIGGQVYRGSELPQLQGVYLFGDYRGRRMVGLRQCGSTTSTVTPILKKADPNQTGASFKSVGGAPALSDLTAIVSDNAGEIYLVANRSTLLKVVAAP